MDGEASCASQMIPDANEEVSSSMRDSTQFNLETQHIWMKALHCAIIGEIKPKESNIEIMADKTIRLVEGLLKKLEGDLC